MLQPRGCVRPPAYIPALGVVLSSPWNTTSPFCVGGDGQCAVVCLQLACLLEWGQTFVFHVVCQEFELERPKSIILCQHGIDRRFCDPKVLFIYPYCSLDIHRFPGTLQKSTPNVTTAQIKGLAQIKLLIDVYTFFSFILSFPFSFRWTLCLGHARHQMT